MKKLYLSLLLLFFAVISVAQPTFESLKTFGGTGIDSYAKIAFDSNNNQFVIGYFRNTVDFDPGPGTFNLTSAGSDDAYIMKLDNLGNFLWAKRIGGTGSDGIGDIAINSQNELIVTGVFQNTVDFDPGMGTFNLTASGQQDFIVEKLDNNGNFIFCKSISGPFSDICASVELDDSDNIYTTGWFTGSSTDFDPGAGVFNLSAQGADPFVWKLDSNGNFVWAKKVGSNSDDTATDLKIDNQGNVIVTGLFLGTVDFDPNGGTFNLTSNGQADMFLLKLSSAGNFIWAKSVGGTSSEQSGELIIDANQNIIVFGNFSNSVDFNPGAATFNLVSQGLLDIFILKLDFNGSFVWAKSIGGSLDDYSSDITEAFNDQFYIAGKIQGTVDLDPGIGITNYSSAGSFDFFFSLFDSNGNTLWTKTVGGSGEDIASGVYKNQNSLHIPGIYSNTVDFDPNSGVQNSTSNGLQDCFILKLYNSSCSFTVYDTITTTITNTVYDTVTVTLYDTITTTIYDTITTSISVTDTLIINAVLSGVNPPNNTNTLLVYPNPARTHITIDNGNFALMNGYTVRINNALGQTVFTQAVNQQQFFIDLSTWTGSGLYYLDLIDNSGNSVETKVIVVQ